MTAVPKLRKKIRERRAALATLRQQVSALEQGWTGAAEKGAPALLPLGAGPVDTALRGGLARAACHEILPAAYGDEPAALSFALALTARQTGGGPVLWCLRAQEAREFGRPYGPGLASLGLPPERLIIVTVRTDCQVLQAMEEGLRARALAAVIGGAEGVDLTASRRLALAAEEGNTPALLLRPYAAVSASAARSRWRIAALPGVAHPLDPHAPGLPRWQVTLERCRNGRPGQWALDWNYETHRFHLAAPLADRPAAAGGGRNLRRTA